MLQIIFLLLVPLFSAAWEQELNGVTSEEEFMTYLEQQLRKLDEEGEL